MSKKIQAIVIKSSDKKEKDKSVLLFSVDEGKIWATLKGVKSPKAKMKLACNPFCFGEFLLEDGHAGQIVTNFEVIETFHEISEDIDKFFEGSAILEILNSLEFTQELPQVFILALKTLKNICFSKTKRIYALNKFLLELFKICGVGLVPEKCAVCGNKSFDRFYINFLDGTLECLACKSLISMELSKTTYSALKILNGTEMEKISTLKLAGNSEVELLKVLVKNFENRFDKKLKLMGILS